MKKILIIGCGLLGSSLLRRIHKKKIAKKIYNNIDKKKYKFSKRAKENKELYGSIKPKEISKTIENISKIEIKPSQIDLAKEINRSDLNVTLAQETLMELSGVLGLNLGVNQDSINGDVAPLIELLIDARSQLRSAKMYEEADQIRDSLEQLGYVLEDGSGSTSWKLQIKQSSK